MKVLVIEDDLKIVDMLILTLKMRWPNIVIISTHSGTEGIKFSEKENPDLIFLDLGLPDTDGLNVLKQIRFFSNVPIIILTVRKEEQDIVSGLELGADDYITKPFHQAELLARTRTAIRRMKSETDNELPIVAGALSLIPPKRKLIYDKRDIFLTATESCILEILMKNAGHWVSTRKIAQSLWGDDYPGSDNAIRVYICRLRGKLESDPNKPQLINSKQGLGYRLLKQS